MNIAESRYKEECETPSDINEHLPTLYRYASKCDHVTELRSGAVVPTWALLAAGPKELLTIYAHHPGEGVNELMRSKGETTLYFKVGEVLGHEFKTDLLFLDTFHTYKQLSAELNSYADSTRKYIIIHDTVIYGEKGDDGGEGMNKALDDFLGGNRFWRKVEEHLNNNGLVVLQKFRERELAGLDDNVKVKTSVSKWESMDIQLPEIDMNIKKAKRVKFIIPFPDVPYYLGQILVQINNFRRMGYEADTHYVGFYMTEKPSDIIQKFIDSPDIKAHFHMYPDDRPDKAYPASSKPRMMKNYFRDFPKEKKNVYMYLDPDVIFLQRFNFEPFIHRDWLGGRIKKTILKLFGKKRDITDNIWYESDTRSYVDSNYIKSKGEQLFYEMCEISGIDPKVVERNDKNAGGAQYITKNNYWEFWEDVEVKSIALYKHMDATKTKYHPEGHDYPIQQWTAEMYQQNWTAWRLGVETKVVPELNFYWANGPMEEIKHCIFHNAGIATAEDPLHYCKIKYQSSPFKKDIPTKKESISYYYMLEVKDTEKSYPKLIWD